MNRTEAPTEIDHLRAENTRLKQRIRALERTQDPTWIRRQSQRAGLDQACVQLIYLRRERSGNPPYDAGWCAACEEAIDRISSEITEIMELLYGKPEQLSLPEVSA
ncbi:MAG: hypothetical protein ACRDQA_30670 [Nocardioidaceae bacterium]